MHEENVRKLARLFITIVVGAFIHCAIAPVIGEENQGDATTQSQLGQVYYDLGLKYDQGIEVPKDEAQAAKWYRKAADLGYAKAQYFLGLMYDAGRGVPNDETEAVKWYRKAADQGFAWAQND